MQGNPFLKNVSMIVGGTVFAQIINILVSPVLTRIYQPEMYGVFSTFNSLVAIFSISASLDYQNAIPLEKEDEDAVHLYFLAFVILIVVCILFGIVFLFRGDILLAKLNYSNMIPYKYFLIIGIFLTGLYNILMQTAFRMDAFQIIARTKYVQCFFSNGVKIIVGLISKSSIGLVIGAIIGQSAGISNLYRILKSSLKDFRFSGKKIKKLMIKYKKFPLFSAPNNYINSMSVQMPVLMISGMFGSDIVGYFSLANQIVAIPALFIGTAIGQVFYAQISKIKNRYSNQLKKECLRILIKMTILGGVIFLMISIFLPFLITIVYGEEWRIAGDLARILCINAFASFLVIPLGRVLEIINQQQISLIFNTIRVIVLFGVFNVARIYNYNIYQALLGFSIVSALFYILLIMVILRQLKINTEVCI